MSHINHFCYKLAKLKKDLFFNENMSFISNRHLISEGTIIFIIRYYETNGWIYWKCLSGKGMIYFRVIPNNCVDMIGKGWAEELSAYE